MSSIRKALAVIAAFMTFMTSPARLLAQSPEILLAETRDWLEYNVVSLTAPPAKGRDGLISFKVDGCSTLRLTWARWGKDGMTSQSGTELAPISWRKVSVRTPFSLPSTITTYSGGVNPTPKVIEATPAPEPGSTGLTVEYKEPVVTFEEPGSGSHRPRKGFGMMLQSLDAAEDVKERLDRLAKLCTSK
jgi:hypothetical protein